MIILDLGSGNTCKNGIFTVRRMIDSLEGADVIIKWQLFERAPPNIPLYPEVFAHAFSYAEKKGYQTTASVFDLASLRFLEQFDVPWIKFANNPRSRELMSYTDMYKVISYGEEHNCKPLYDRHPLCCVSKYPARMMDYVKTFPVHQLKTGISDHTVGLHLYKSLQPEVWEKHYVLEHDPENPDAGPFAMIPKDLEEL